LTKLWIENIIGHVEVVLNTLKLLYKC
jgi:hypothetical protein